MQPSGSSPTGKYRSPQPQNEPHRSIPRPFFVKVRDGKTTQLTPKKHLIFSQGDEANAVFYVQTGWVKLTVVSEHGKEAVVGLLNSGSFFGEGCLAGQLLYMATATAQDESTIVRIDKGTMIRVLHDESSFSEMFMAYLLSRNVRT